MRFHDTLESRDAYLEEFIKALEKHCRSVDNEHRNILMNRLKQRVEELNKNKNNL